MDEQMGMFTPQVEWSRDVAVDQKGEVLKEEAISRVEANASRAWLDEAWHALRYLVGQRQATVTSDDIWRTLAEWSISPPHEPRAMGPVMRRGVKERLLLPTTTFVPSDLPQNHRRPVRVYWTQHNISVAR